MKKSVFLGGLAAGLLLMVFAIFSGILVVFSVQAFGIGSFARVACLSFGIAGAAFFIKSGKRFQGSKEAAAFFLVGTVVFFALNRLAYHLPSALLAALPALKMPTDRLEILSIPIISNGGTALEQFGIAFYPVLVIGSAYIVGTKSAISTEEKSLFTDKPNSISSVVKRAFAAGFVTSACHHMVFMLSGSVMTHETLGLWSLAVDAVIAVLFAVVASSVYWRLGSKEIYGENLVLYALLSLIFFAAGIVLMLVLDVAFPNVMFMGGLFMGTGETGDGVGLMLVLACFTLTNVVLNTIRTSFIAGKRRRIV